MFQNSIRINKVKRLTYKNNSFLYTINSHLESKLKTQHFQWHQKHKMFRIIFKYEKIILTEEILWKEIKGYLSGVTNE